ncbi:MAG: lanthionine synthetase C family protein [Lysobacterales bacterium]
MTTIPHSPRAGLPQLLADEREGALALCAAIAAAARHAAREPSVTLSIPDQVSLAQFLSAWSATDVGAAEDSRRLYASACQQLGAVRLPFYWIGGLAGVASALSAHARASGDAGADFSEVFDQGLLAQLSHPQWPGDFDLICGLTGYGIYALEHADPDYAGQLIEQILDRLAELGTRDAAGLRWHTDARLLPPAQRQRHTEGYHNLGLAHGAAGVIGLLARCVETDCHADRARDMLVPAVEWLLAQGSMPADAQGFWFPNVVERPDQSRPLAWCYGDLGIAVALLRAASACANPAWQRVAGAVARHCAGRRGEAAAVADAGLCHGSAGAALIFLRCWQQTGDEVLAEAARYWLTQTAHFRQPALTESAGFFRDEGERTVAALDLLTGAAGVGLALLSCLGASKQYWDAPLLTDLRGARPAP